MTDVTTGRGTDYEPAKSGPTPLLPHDESDKFELQLQHAVSGVRRRSPDRR
ncbi:hypothetical protein [Streptomyces sp. T12]|uniref:hypothetical protein n=1 Tax=Streptomyces sp. T12 TaxID=477697 RepID=UPI0035A2617A